MAPKTNAERVREHRHRISELGLWGLVADVADEVARDVAEQADVAMRTYNRGGMTWQELDAAFVRLRLNHADRVSEVMTRHGFTHPPQGYGE